MPTQFNNCLMAQHLLGYRHHSRSRSDRLWNYLLHAGNSFIYRTIKRNADQLQPDRLVAFMYHRGIIICLEYAELKVYIHGNAEMSQLHIAPRWRPEVSTKVCKNIAATAWLSRTKRRGSSTITSTPDLVLVSISWCETRCAAGNFAVSLSPINTPVECILPSNSGLWSFLRGSCASFHLLRHFWEILSRKRRRRSASAKSRRQKIRTKAICHLPTNISDAIIPNTWDETDIITYKRIFNTKIARNLCYTKILFFHCICSVWIIVIWITLDIR